MKRPIRTAFATVPSPGGPPSSQATTRMTTPTQTFASPNVSGVCFAIPWWRTSQGQRPSFDSSVSTIARAKSQSPKTRLTQRTAKPPRMTGCVRVLNLEPERIEGLRRGRDENGLRLEVELERVEPELAAEPRLLVAAERDPRKGGVRHVDPDLAGLDAGREPVAARRVAGPHGRHQTVLRVVRDPDCVFLVFERGDRDDRPEDLLLRDDHAVVDLGENRWRI